MNIFFVHNDPKVCAQMLCDKHIVKMPSETAQILLTAFDELDVILPLNKSGEPYSTRGYYNHPCCKWARESKGNFLWLLKHGRSLCDEYRRRYGKDHYSENVIEWISQHIDFVSFERDGFCDPPQCMLEQYRSSSTVESYREYCRREKAYFAKWKWGNVPEWFQN